MIPYNVFLSLLIVLGILLLIPVSVSIIKLERGDRKSFDILTESCVILAIFVMCCFLISFSSNVTQDRIDEARKWVNAEQKSLDLRRARKMNEAMQEYIQGLR